MQNEQIKLQNAFNKGYVPADLKKVMSERGHVGQVWLVGTQEYSRQVLKGMDRDDNPIYKDEPATRLGVGYKTVDTEGVEENHIHWYEQESVKALLKEI